MFQLSHFEREAFALTWQLPSSCFLLKSPVLMLKNSMLKSSLLVTKLGVCDTLGHHFHDDQ